MKLASLTVWGVLVAPRAVLLQFHPVWIIAAVLLGDVSTLLALGAGKRDLWTDVRNLLGHFDLLHACSRLQLRSESANRRNHCSEGGN